MADNSTVANALAVIAGVLSTGTSTPQQSSSKPSEKPIARNDVMLIPAPSFSRLLPSKTGKQWTYWKVTYNFRNG